MQQKFEPKDFSKTLQGLKSSLTKVVNSIDRDLITLDQNTLYKPQEKTASLKKRLNCQNAAQGLINDIEDFVSNGVYNFEAYDKYSTKLKTFLSKHLNDTSIPESVHKDAIQVVLDTFQKQIKILKDMPQITRRSANVSIIKGQEVLDASVSRKSSISSISPSTSFESSSPTSSVLQSSSSSSRRSSTSSISSSSSAVFEIPLNNSTLQTPATSPSKPATSPSSYKGWLKQLVGYGSPSKGENSPAKQAGVLAKSEPNARTPAVLSEEEFVIDNVHDSLKKILTEILQEIQAVDEFIENRKNIVTKIEALLSKINNQHILDLCLEIEKFSTKFQHQFPNLLIVSGSMLGRLKSVLNSEELIENEFDLISKTTVYNAKLEQEDEVVVKKADNNQYIEVYDFDGESGESFINQYDSSESYDDGVAFFSRGSKEKSLLKNMNPNQDDEDIFTQEFN